MTGFLDRLERPCNGSFCRNEMRTVRRDKAAPLRFSHIATPHPEAPRKRRLVRWTHCWKMDHKHLTLRHSGARRSRETGIHRAAGAGGEMDSGLDASHRPGMTEEKFGSDFMVICPVHPSREKHSAFALGQISTINPRVSPR
ncbi:hypothetical protein I6F35_33375 [Bradyrhizobium sp. BRP22]|uniref:hypothetical protein n=1 Tax=Bradyrhizobium sp. BRP22 TaxID=2793821 RepID=UPI001CD23D56|nr:hypothetical protein [Bradyrhizobium sp. BRP22]MCA1458027.1 hypothetical protein [Bradyrhizobium sp. BRP22]